MQRLAADLPDERRLILQGMRETVAAAVDQQYRAYPARPGQLPPAFSGEYGTRTKVRVAPQMGAITISNDSPYTAFIEGGRPPGYVSKAIIEDWAERKLGLDAEQNPGAVRAIQKRIIASGYAAMNLLERATSPFRSDGAGPDMHRELGYILREEIDKIIRKYGWR